LVKRVEGQRRGSRKLIEMKEKKVRVWG